MLNFNAGLINIVKKTVRNENADWKLFLKVNTEAMKGGYLVEPAACSEVVYDWVKTYVRYNPNSTFYKTWEDIESRSQEELWLNAIFHYITTYGTNFSLGNGFTFNESPVEIDYTQYQILRAVDEEEIFNDVYGLIKSGIALSTSTVNIIADFIDKNNLYGKIDIEKVNNKEIMPILCIKGGLLPKDEFNLLRLFIYYFTDSPMLIKSKSAIKTIKKQISDCINNRYNCKDKKMLEVIKNLDWLRKEKLSRIFYRFKPLFLAMKCSETSKTINQIRRLANKNHTPLKVGFWEKVLTPVKIRGEKEERIKYVTEHSSEISIYKRISLVSSIVEKMVLFREHGSSHKRMFRIRNGKVYITDNKIPSLDEDYCYKISDTIMDSIFSDLKKKYQKEDGSMPSVRLPRGINLVMPISEKNFVGDIPSGSYIKLNDKDNIIGIYWRNEWGARDLDLHFMTLTGSRYGWNSDYKGDGIYYSGDMTNADPEAAELYKFDKDKDGVFTVQQYTGNDKYAFNFFVAKDSFDNIKNLTGKSWNVQKSYKCMVDPNKIIYNTHIETDLTGNNIGIIDGDKFVFTQDSLGGGRLPNYEMIEQGMESLIVKNLSKGVKIKDVLQESGFNIVNDNDTETEVDYDFTVITRNELIDFFSLN